MNIDERVGHVEREQARQGQELRHVSSELGSVKASVSDVGHDVKKLLEREARRPAPMSVVTVVATLGSIGAAAGVVWWLIGNSPAVQDLGRRMDRLDDPQVGRVPTLEKRVETLTGWRPVQVVKGR